MEDWSEETRLAAGQLLRVGRWLYYSRKWMVRDWKSQWQQKTRGIVKETKSIWLCDYLHGLQGKLKLNFRFWGEWMGGCWLPLLRRLRACVRLEVFTLASEQKLEWIRALQMERWVLGSSPQQNGLGWGTGDRIWQQVDSDWLQIQEWRKLPSGNGNSERPRVLRRKPMEHPRLNNYREKELVMETYLLWGPRSQPAPTSDRRDLRGLLLAHGRGVPVWQGCNDCLTSFICRQFSAFFSFPQCSPVGSRNCYLFFSHWRMLACNLTVATSLLLPGL